MPIIGIVPKQLGGKEPRCAVAQNYLDSIIAAGGAPLIMPTTSQKEPVEQLLELVDGILLIGGADIDPARYGEAPLDGSSEFAPVRDGMEWHVLSHAVAHDLPVFGICRGMQMINVFFGGSLYQDLPRQCEPMDSSARCEHLVFDEAGDYDGDRLVHRVSLTEGSKLATIFGATDLEVNSLHHQAVRRLAPGFHASAVASDGVIEGIESTDGHIVGVQWHPEYFGMRDPMARFFKALVQTCADHVKRSV